MENNINQTQPVETQVEIQKKEQKPWIKLSKTQILIIVSILILIIGIGLGIYQYNAAKVTNTGAVNSEHTPPPNDPYVEYNKLENLGNFSADGFNVASISASTNLAVFLNSPYDASQTKFQNWLKANGYGEIPQDKIIYFHNP